MKNPSCYDKLTREIDTAIAQSTLSIPALYSQASKLPYLKACVNEGMRLHPSVGLTLPRLVPAGGTRISEFEVPGGYGVGINAAVIQYDQDVFGMDAEKFRPERWIDGDAVMMEKTILQFGAGPRTCIGKNVRIVPMRIWQL